MSGEWAVEQIIGHSGSKTDSLFKVKWKSGDVTWLPYEKADHLDALGEYFDALGILDVSQLRDSQAPAPEDDELDVLGLSEVRVSTMEVHPGWENSSVAPHYSPLLYLHTSLTPSSFPNPLLSCLPTPLPDTRLNILGLDSYGTGLWTVNDREDNQKFLTNSKSIHMCLLLSERIRKGTFDICRDPIPTIYFPLARIFNNSCVTFDVPYRMVWLPTDRIASKVVIEGEPVKFEHLFSDDDEYAKKHCWGR
ncbi:hypothetical protein EV421DRAFT_1911771 [Armillaria borealis]|uniref:Chromo domain-containing protein n=1 Tax=Armillaria borealis TaxID=47425 RepID=A0AA39IW03_9AGAR|nr:hypothetical protein EV421DRAFT_1911771 [Armillaria borealis]